MVLFFILISLLAVLAGICAVNPRQENSCGHMLNVDWLEDSDKFALITRWGVRG